MPSPPAPENKEDTSGVDKDAARTTPVVPRRGGGEVEYARDASVFTFSPSSAQRRRAALVRGALAATLTTCVLGLIFLPDYLANHAGKSLEQQILYAASLVLVGALIGFALMVSRHATRETWILDVAREELVCERRLFGLSPRREALELKQVREFVIHDQALQAVLADGYVLDLVREDFETKQGRRFLDELSAFCRERYPRLDVARRT